MRTFIEFMILYFHLKRAHRFYYAK